MPLQPSSRPHLVLGPEPAQRAPNKKASARARLYPEVAAGGFTHVDGTIEFYSRINSLLRDDMTVLDLGGGRGAWFYDDRVRYRRDLRYIRPRVHNVIGLDIDPSILENRSVDQALLIDPSGTFPLPSNCIDLAICDAVFEHVTDPLTFSAEIARVVKPGGWLCARTPNRWGYPALAARLIPNRLHNVALRLLQPYRQAEDIFPTIFLLNSPKQLAKAFHKTMWRSFIYYASGEPAYAGSSFTAWRAFELVHRMAPRPLQTSLFIFLQRLS